MTSTTSNNPETNYDFNCVLDDIEYNIRSAVKRSYDLQPTFYNIKSFEADKSLVSTKEWKLYQNVVDCIYTLQKGIFTLRHSLETKNIIDLHKYVDNIRINCSTSCKQENHFDYKCVLDDINNYIKSAAKRLNDLQPTFNSIKIDIFKKNKNKFGEEIYSDWQLYQNIAENINTLQIAIDALRDGLDVNYIVTLCRLLKI